MNEALAAVGSPTSTPAPIVTATSEPPTATPIPPSPTNAPSPAPPTATRTPQPIATTILITEGSDDAEERLDTGRMYLPSGDLEMTYDSDQTNNEDSPRGEQIVGLRFVDLPVPSGSKITQTYIEFVADSKTNSDSTQLTIYGQAQTNPLGFTEESRNISNRLRTNAMVSWTVPAWNTDGVSHRTPDLSTIVQEVIDQNGWSRENSMVFIITGNNHSSNFRTAKSSDGAARESDPNNAPKLFIEYIPEE
ncbi:MAG: hypothetical protein AAF485_04810 [Chloroflexota bacterium]